MTDKTATRPTAHILRPHHVALLAVLMLAFREYESKLPGPFILHIYRVLLTEVSEASQVLRTRKMMFSLKQREDS